MALKIRLARYGAKKKPFYRIVIAEATSPRDGKFIEKVGYYDPMVAKDNVNRLNLKEERIKYWISQGAQPTERVEKFLVDANLMKLSKKRKAVIDNRIKLVKERKAEEEAKKKAAETEEAAQ